MTINSVRKFNFALTAVGFLVFAFLLAYMQFAPTDFDQRTRNFAISKIDNSMDKGLASVGESNAADRLSDFAGKISKDLQEQVDDARQSLNSGRDVLISDILAAACKLDCERREAARQAVRGYYKSKMATNSAAIERIQSLVVGKYDEVMGELRKDLSIFSASNALALLFALLLTLFKGRAAKHILPISIALTISTALMIYWYIFGQDWVMTVIFSDYWGWTYGIVLASIAVFLLDIAFNKARITSAVFNTIGSAIGSAASFVPC